jgi:tRNA(adenine34) deaminase
VVIVNTATTDDKKWMQHALVEAAVAEKKGEIPVGAVVVLDQAIIGRGHNQPISQCDPSAHAEMVAIRHAAHRLNNYRLINATLYVTLEPCTMCVGLLIHSRISRVVYATKEPKSGAVHSHLQLLDQTHYNHRIHIKGGVLEKQSSLLISQFFKKNRLLKKQNKINSLDN